MDNESSKMILCAYRADGADAGDPAFAEALAQARSDPELMRWFAEERALDERMHAAIQSLHPPAELKDILLLSVKVSRMRPRRAWWKRPSWMAAAAGVMLFAGLAVFLLRPSHARITLATLTSEMARLQSEDRISLGVLTTDTAQIRRWLKEHGGADDFEAPAGLGKEMRLGCQVLDINGNKVSLICFQTGDEQVVHLLVVDRERLSDAPAVGEPILLQEGELAFEMWSDGNRVYIITGHGRAESLRRWL